MPFINSTERVENFVHLSFTSTNSFFLVQIFPLSNLNFRLNCLMRKKAAKTEKKIEIGIKTETTVARKTKLI